MAENFQQCSHLEIKDEYSGSTTHLDDLFLCQSDTQKNIYGYNFAEMTLRDLMNFWHMNNHALVSEIHEATDALGGIKDGIGSGIWKRWKSTYADAGNMTIASLSESDLTELKMEVVDILHFFLNMAISIGMTPQELYNYYFAKNAENRDRQKRGYK